jgi:hypothetical protein
LIDQLLRGASAKLRQPGRNRFIEAIGFFDEECLRFTRTHVLDLDALPVRLMTNGVTPAF